MPKKGFTLIELLVVIAIIAVLASILFPVFARTKEKARRTKCISNLKQLGLAFQSYRTDYDGKLPAMAYYGWDGTPYRWIHSIYPSVASDALYECPSNEVVDDPNHPTRPFPSSPLPETSYLYSLGCLMAQRMVIFTETDVRDPAGTALLQDGWYFRLGGQAMRSWNGVMFYYAGESPNIPVEQTLAAWSNGRPTNTVQWQTALDRIRRHGNGLNVSYYDGHAKFAQSMTPADYTPEMEGR